MVIRSRLGLVLGAIAALGIPLILLAIGRTPAGASDSTIFDIAVGELVLGPVGLLAAGWAAGLRGIVAWVAYASLAVPILAILWFASIESAIRSIPG
jgi:hypothetical protein